jgi:Histidine kinase-like ATPase domain
MEARSAVRLLRRPIGPGLLPLVELLVTELVSNSVKHGGAGPEDPVRLELIISDQAVRVAVSDLGPGLKPTPQPMPDSDGTRGWGLIMVDRSSARWGTRQGGRCVWFELERNGAVHAEGIKGSAGSVARRWPVRSGQIEQARDATADEQRRDWDEEAHRARSASR